MNQVYETENYIIEYDQTDSDLIEEIITTLNANSIRIMNFFKLHKLDKKVKIVIWNSIEGYKNNIIPYLALSGREYKEWMIADTMDGNINMLPIRLVNRTDYNIFDFSGAICHEFVHICHKQARKQYNVKFSHSDTWFWELLATNLGNYNSKKRVPINISLEELQNNFDNISGNYYISFTIGQYLFENCAEDYIYELAVDNDKLEIEAPQFFETAKEWSQVDELKK